MFFQARLYRFAILKETLQSILSSFDFFWIQQLIEKIGMIFSSWLICTTMEYMTLRNNCTNKLSSLEMSMHIVFSDPFPITEKETESSGISMLHFSTISNLPIVLHARPGIISLKCTILVEAF